MKEEVRRLFDDISIPEDDIKECGFNEKCYEVYNYLSKIFKPERLLEIGTRRGYSLVAMCKDSLSINYVLSCDSECYIEGSQNVAIDNLRRAGYTGLMTFLTMSSHSSEFKNKLRGKRFDLIHIDGDHDLPGVIQDLDLCLPHLADNGIMIVDDYQYIIDVKQATDDFVKKHKLGIIVIDTYRGTAILKRR